MKRLLSNDLAVLVSRLVLGTTFVLASIDKIVVPEAFASAVEAYRMLPFAAVNFFALAVPWLELFCGIMILGGVAVRPSALLVSAMLCMFAAGMVSAIFRNLTIDCGCFGAAHASPVSWMRVLEDIGLLLLGIHLAVFPRSRFGLERPSSPAAP